MKRTITYIIKKEFNNYSILSFLKAQGFTHNVIVTLKKTENGILQNDKWAYVNNTLSTGDTLSLNLIEEVKKTTIVPVNLPLDILYEDEDILIVNKPSDMPIHPSQNNYENTLANAILYYFMQQNEEFTFRCINRLDRDTTGLTIIAKNSLAAGILSQQVSARNIHRKYLAICSGKLEQPDTIYAPIGRKDDSTIERMVRQDGEKAITHYRPLMYNRDYDCTLVELQLETGRTHQIRVHMKHIGHPLPGDFLYNPDYTIIKRQALHSYSLDFVHPITKEKMHFQADLPSDLKCIFPDY